MSLDDLLHEAQEASAPSIVGSEVPGVGGVDPLGLRQINFDLMDQVLPGLNNVADKVRPFVLMAWAWRRVRQVVEQSGKGGATDEEMRDFVDRIEAVYSWSQFLINPSAGIPGGQALAELVMGPASNYRFGGEAWVRRRDTRRSSTGLISPLNYGPGLRSMGWLFPAGPNGVFQTAPELNSMLDAFEANFEDVLVHEAFNVLGEVLVDREDVRAWGKRWALDDLTDDERLAAHALLAGPIANHDRREGLNLVEAAVARSADDTFDTDDIRTKMAELDWDDIPNSAVAGKAKAWRALQTRQLFRLALEGTFHWIVGALSDGPLSSRALAEYFLSETSKPESETTAAWLVTDISNPVSLIAVLEDALRGTGRATVPEAIRLGLAFCMLEDDAGRSLVFQASDRLPISRAKSEFERWRNLPPVEWLKKMIEVWVLAQHAYWCVGRGLTDARGRGKTLLRLRVVMDEGGWTLTPGAHQGNPPIPTPDRLKTALSLLSECGRI